MKTRRRAYPLDRETRERIARGEQTDPRKGPKSGRGSHTPKMAGVDRPLAERPELFTRAEWDRL